jgi:hypothetical protein
MTNDIGGKLVRLRKDRFVSYWETLRNIEVVKFTKEAETNLVLPDVNWQNALFAQLIFLLR